MPLYMDRHDTPGATAEEVAAAHAADISVSAKHNVQFVSYFYDPDNEGVFCLANAPAAENLTAVHQESHGMLPNEIISVSEGDILRFLGGIQEPAHPAEAKNPFRAILFTDLEGSTSLLNEVGEQAFMDLLKEHDAVIRRSLMSAKGREIKHTGDGIMASFDDVAGSLDCSLAIQDGFTARTMDEGKRELKVRIGISAGEPVDHNDDLFGSAVNLAARICDAADAGQVLVSDIVRELGAKSGFSFQEAEARALKGFSDPTQVFELIPKSD